MMKKRAIYWIRNVEIDEKRWYKEVIKNVRINRLMGIKEKILVVEDDKAYASFMSAILTHNEYEVISAGAGEMAVHMTASHSPDLILLDLGLPDIDGMDVLKRIREWSDIPVIIVSARQSEQDKVSALDSGANDYVTKPFGSDELLARIRAAIRIQRRSVSTRKANVFTNSGLVIDYERRIVTVDDAAVQLTPTEYKIVVMLSQNAGKVLTHEYMRNYLWGPYAGESQTLRVNIANIRRKIEKAPSGPKYIVTETGVGYRMVEL